jgi:hypothetical protein
VQIRSQALLSDVVVSIVAKALDAHREDIKRGAPVDRRGRDARQSAASPPVPGSAVAPVGLTVTRPPSPSLVARVWTREGGTGWGNRNSGAPFPCAQKDSRLGQFTARNAVVTTINAGFS